MTFVEVKKIDEIKKWLKTIPKRLESLGLEAVSVYIIGNDSHGLKHYPARKNHGPDNPYQWQTEKQRRAYFASDGFGAGIPYRRTNELKNSYEVEINDAGNRAWVFSTSDRAKFVVGEFQQRGHIVDGWRQVLAVVYSNLAGAIRYAQAKINQAVKRGF